jgi:methylated-DNA-protein-cysteine methyltransferase-like protein
MVRIGRRGSDVLPPPPDPDTLVTMLEPSRRVVDLIRSIPRGRVATYGQIAVMAGMPNGARQVARLLHSSSGKHRLPWHRVINASGGISLAAGSGGELQRAMLEKEGVLFHNNKVNLRRYAWRPTLAE